MTQPSFPLRARAAALTLAVTLGSVALAGCEQRPYPTAGPTAAPGEREAALAGAPTTRSPEYVPPPQGEYGAPPPPPGYPAPPPAPGYGPQGGYPPPPGSGGAPAPYARAPGAPPEVVTMAPIPNPPERPQGQHRRYDYAHDSRPYRLEHRGRHRYDHASAPAYAYPHAHRRHRHGRRRMMASAAPAPMAAMRPHPRHAAPPAGRPAAAQPAPVRPAAPAGAQLPKPATPHHHKVHKVAAAAGGAATAAAASGGSTNLTGPADASTNATANATGSEADRYQALERSLKDAFGSAAALKAPAHMQANEAATVTLELPADFDQTVRDEAAKQSLADAAASVSLSAALTGSGYAITPDQPQSQALALNTPTSFSWKVTPTGAGRGALKAAVRAQVADGHDLDLGSKSTGSGTTGRVVGIGILALIALVLLGWAAQRRRPAPTGAVKPRVANFDGDPPKT